MWSSSFFFGLEYLLLMESSFASTATDKRRCSMSVAWHPTRRRVNIQNLKLMPPSRPFCSPVLSPVTCLIKSLTYSWRTPPLSLHVIATGTTAISARRTQSKVLYLLTLLMHRLPSHLLLQLLLGYLAIPPNVPL
jgi:hypothetical protein